MRWSVSASPSGRLMDSSRITRTIVEEKRPLSPPQSEMSQATRRVRLELSQMNTDRTS